VRVVRPRRGTGLPSPLVVALECCFEELLIVGDLSAHPACAEFALARRAMVAALTKHAPSSRMKAIPGCAARTVVASMVACR